MGAIRGKMMEVHADLRHGVRLVARYPGLSTTVILLLGLGIGATAAMFGVLRSALLQPLPLPSPDRLVMAWETEAGVSRVPVSPPNFLDWRESAASFRALEAYSPRPYGIAGGDEPVRVSGAAVSSGMLEVLGVAPLHGRTFAPGEDRPGAEPVVLLGHDLWQERFAGSTGILGEGVLLNGEPHTVVGILPPGLDLPSPWTLGQRTEVLTPLELHGSLDHRDSHWLLVLGRLADGVPREAAESELRAIAARLEKSYPDSNRGHGARLGAFHEELFGWSRAPLLTLLGAAACVLLVVCANAGGLLLSRTVDRERELAIRRSLGASRGRVVRQLVLEGAPLVAAGGATGILAAAWGLDLLGARIPYPVVRANPFGLDPWSASFAILACSVALALLCVAPALVASSVDVARSLKGIGASRAGGRSGGRRALVAAQIALTVVLANGALLLLTSHQRLRGVQPGFDPEGLYSVGLQFDGPRYGTLESVHALLDDLLPRLESLPGVAAASAVSKLPLHGGTNETIVVEGREEAFAPEGGPLTERSLVSPGYFETMGIRLLAGRSLEEDDGRSTEPVAVVNEAMARVCWPGEDPLGKRFSLEAGSPWLTVVGVVGDVRQWGAEHAPIPEYYLPSSSLPAYWAGWQPQRGHAFLVLRIAGEAEGTIDRARQAIRGLDPLQAVSGVESMSDLLQRATTRRRFQAWLVGSFAAAALVLVASGLYGLLSLFVSRRGREIGLRMALGADAAAVRALVLRYGLTVCGTGLLFGFLGVGISGSLLRGLLYGVDPASPLVLLAGLGAVGAGMLAGIALPAWRAARLDPARALRGADSVL